MMTKTPDWIVKRLNKLGIVRRTSLACDCGGQSTIKGDTDVKPLFIATCMDCGATWGILK